MAAPSRSRSAAPCRGGTTGRIWRRALRTSIVALAAAAAMAAAVRGSAAWLRLPARTRLLRSSLPCSSTRQGPTARPVSFLAGGRAGGGGAPGAWGKAGGAAASARGAAAAAQVAEAASPTGEWAFRASVLGNEGALSGHVSLDSSGRAAYLADGVQIVGRGVGHWVRNGQAAAVELDVYQYAAAAASIPEKPHRFRGVWLLDGGPDIRGDWYFCPEGEPPRLVGSFDAASTTMELLPAAMQGTSINGPAPRLAAGPRDMMMKALDAQPQALRSVGPGTGPHDLLAPYQIGEVASVYYIPDWIEPSQEAEFLSIADGDMKQWEDMKTRSSQEWGAGDRCTCGRGLMRMPLPESQQSLADALHHMGVFDGAMYPMNSVRINGYVPGQGIFPHCDGPVYYPKVAILSLCAPTIFSFYTRTGTEDCMKWDPDHDVPGGYPKTSAPQVDVLLEPRSLLVFGHDAFWHHRHGIAALESETVTEKVCNLEALGGRWKVGDRVDRARRVSLTMRHLLPRCACQG